MSEQLTELRLGDAAKFYAPLALNNLMMMMSHTLIAAGLARTESPVVALAAFALARSVVHMVENPLLTVRQLTMVFSSTRAGAGRTVRFVGALAAVIAGFLLVLGFGPFGQDAIAGLFNVGDEAAGEVVRALRVFAVIPFLVGFRSFYQGVLILSRNTGALPIGTLLRLTVIVVWVLIVPHVPGWGAASGAAALVAAIAVETLFIVTRYRRQTALGVGPDHEGQADTSYRAIVWFALPLTLMTLLHTMSIPVVNFGLGRLSGAITAMAAFAVGESLSKLALAPVESLHQLTLVFGARPAAGRMLRRVIIGFGAAMTGVLLLISVTVLDPIIVRVMGVTGETALWAAWVFRVLVFKPLVVSVREYYWGLMFRRRHTAAIGVGKALNLVTVGVMMALGLRFMDRAGAGLGAIGLLLGEAVEAAFVLKFGGDPGLD